MTDPAGIFAHSRGGTDPRTASDWTRRQVASNNLRALVGRAYPRVRGMTREPSWLFFEILLPFLTTSAFVLVYRALEAPEAYVGFVVLGGALSAFWLNVVWMMAGAAVLGEEPGQPGALLRRADEPHGGPAGHGRGRPRDELPPRGRGPRDLGRSCSA